MTMEAFSSQGDGTLTLIKEISSTDFEVEQTVQTKPHARTCTLDTKKNQIILIATSPTPAQVVNTAIATSAPATVGIVVTSPADTIRSGTGQHGERDGGSPSLLDILVVGR